MTEFGNPLVAAEVARCIAEAREPTADELATVAARIRREAAPLFAWGAPADAASDAYARAASAAMRGNTERSPLRHFR
jgi:hypothetical protein